MEDHFVKGTHVELLLPIPTQLQFWFTVSSVWSHILTFVVNRLNWEFKQKYKATQLLDLRVWLGGRIPHAFIYVQNDSEITIQSSKPLIFIKQKQNPKQPPRPQMYLKLTENVLWYSKPMFPLTALRTWTLCTVTVHHWLTPIGHLLMNQRPPSPDISPCTHADMVLPLSGRCTNQRAI